MYSHVGKTVRKLRFKSKKKIVILYAWGKYYYVTLYTVQSTEYRLPNM